ncbi:branched-chain amino acid ABC transporter substrate-binding protein [Chryseobacterium indologenes]|uniref:branched-chain amino acid ABC transporter substrate-binding protein n=1 Tax=Chryseobacterium indologenes TaxID=253 RepID=UPI0025789682|nr:branched-chain amino acid ABC transporter substrate-binding protein [Chryseobacterium indologenes]MDM1553222.1 branched-chain amino acid ABC transporter substrate-binding protein [Chryseobacterium indologenes]
MSWNIFEVLGTVIDTLSNIATLSNMHSGVTRLSSTSPSKKNKKKDKYFTEKVSAGFILASVVLFFVVFHKPLPVGDQTTALIVSSLIGTAISALLFFLLNLMELHYFKNIFKLLLFSCSVIAFFIALVMCVYYKSGVFI